MEGSLARFGVAGIGVRGVGLIACPAAGIGPGASLHTQKALLAGFVVAVLAFWRNKRRRVLRLVCARVHRCYSDVK
jgi:hypothetical protein